MRRTFNEFIYLLSGIAAAAVWFALLLAGWLVITLSALTPLVVPVLIRQLAAYRLDRAAEAGASPS